MNTINFEKKHTLLVRSTAPRLLQWIRAVVCHLKVGQKYSHPHIFVCSSLPASCSIYFLTHPTTQNGHERRAQLCSCVFCWRFSLLYVFLWRRWKELVRFLAQASAVDSLTCAPVQLAAFVDHYHVHVWLSPEKGNKWGLTSGAWGKKWTTTSTGMLRK